MNYKELFDIISTRGNKLCYPFDYSGRDIDYLDYVSELVKEYKHLIYALDEESIRILNNAYDRWPTSSPIAKPLDIIEDVKIVAEVVERVLKSCFSCYYDDAYQILDEFFRSFDYHYYKLLPQYRSFSGRDHFYRMRSDKKNVDFDNPQGEMFHIPYHLRYLVSTQRYSIPGYPVLYLAGSFLTSWTELDKPRLQDVVYAKLKFIEEQSFIDLAYPLSKNPRLWEYYSLFIFYPLMIACMVQVKHPNAPFKPEYCLPQQMLNIVRSIDSGHNVGIVYMSNKLPESMSIFSIESRNFAVVVRDVLCRKGYDVKLSQKMMMTKPVVFSDSDIEMLSDSCCLKELVKFKERTLRFHSIQLNQE